MIGSQSPATSHPSDALYERENFFGNLAQSRTPQIHTTEKYPILPHDTLMISEARITGDDNFK